MRWLTRFSSFAVGGIVAIVGMVASGQPSQMDVISDFEDGTLQGWTLEEPGAALIEVTPNGNPGFSLISTDIVFGLNIAVTSPSPFTSDLPGFAEVRLDEFVYSDPDPDPVHGALVVLVCEDGTRWRANDRSILAIDSWATRVIPLTENYWENGADTGLSFDQVLANLVQFRIDLDTLRTLTRERSALTTSRSWRPSTLTAMGSWTRMTTVRWTRSADSTLISKVVSELDEFFRYRPQPGALGLVQCLRVTRNLRRRSLGLPATIRADRFPSLQILAERRVQ